MKKIVRCYIVGFVLVLVLPYLVYLYVAKYLDLENHENHELVTMQDVLDASWNEKTIILEDCINDHIPYKNELTKLNTLVDINIFKSLDSQSVLLGKDNWLFYKKDNCLEDYCRVLSVSEEEIEDTIMSMQNLQEYCDERGIELVYMVTPNKESIYGNLYMPDYVKVAEKTSRVETFLQNINNETDINIIFPETELKEARDAGYQVYKKYDTHWNQLGGYVGTMRLLEALKMDTQDLGALTVYSGNNITGDLANMIGMGTVYNDDIDYRLDGYKNNIQPELIEERDEPNLKYSHYRTDIPDGKTIVCIGDSFLEATEEYLAKNYKESYFMHISNYVEGTIEAADPDVIVITSTERAFPGLHWSIDNMLELCK